MIDFNKYQRDINKICSRHGVKSLTAFGSALSEAFDDASDIDFLLVFETAEGGIKKYMRVKFELEEIFARPVDLVMPGAVKNTRLKDYISENTRQVYAA